MIQPARDSASLVEEILASTPLRFIREFLRTQKQGGRRVRIGTTRAEAKANLLEALAGGDIGVRDLEEWYREIEGWGKQHLYIFRTHKRVGLVTQLLSTSSLSAYLKRKEISPSTPIASAEATDATLAHIDVDDEWARLVWRARADAWERHEDLDETRELGDPVDPDEYQFRAWRRVPRRAASRLVIRKTDGIALILITQLLGEEHDRELAEVLRVADLVIAPHAILRVPLSNVIVELDQSAVATGTKAKHGIELTVEARHSRFSADGARILFETTSESHGYADSEPVRRVRKSMQVEKFVGEDGKFQLHFLDESGAEHVAIASLNAFANRTYLFSRMKEREVWTLADHLLELS